MLTSKITATLAAGVFVGGAFALWALFGGEVYLAYAAGAMLRCF